MDSSFVHLHVHTEFSMLDGASRLDELVAKAAQEGMPALGITDHGNMYGVLDFYRACRKQGIKPIIGTELYQAHESRTERPPRRGKVDDSGGSTDSGKKMYYHMTALAENNTGYKNLIQLASRAFMEGYYYKPRVDWEVLSEHSEGVIATTGCLGGQVLQALMRGEKEEAIQKAGRLQDIFGKDNLFVELQDHGIPEQLDTNPQLIELAKKIGAPLLATNDSHYTEQHDHLAHDALLCVQTGSLMSDPDRFKFHGDQHYLKTSKEMRVDWSEVPEACDNTLWIAERCDVEIEFGKPLLPDFPIPEPHKNSDDYLLHLTMEGAKKRWGSGLTDEIRDRLVFELDVIKTMGFSSYFLITWDLIVFARESNIRVGPGRGSAAGCAVAYCLWITDLDPIEYDLVFERFLNPSRISMPDIDMDFDSRYRDEMINYAARRYGRDHVAQIVTFSQIKARAAVRDAARVLGYPYVVGDKVAKAMPPLIMGRDTPLKYCFEEDPKYSDGFKAAANLREMVATDSDVERVIDVAKGLEGLRRQDGIHAAAVVITKEPLTEYLPIQRKPSSGQDPEDAPVVTQYEMHGVEDLGLLKMDFLGLRTLDVISDTLELVKRVKDIDIDIDNVDLADEPTYEMLREGQSVGIFQLESSPMRALIRQMAPTEFEDIAALVALYRPGPMAANMHTDYADRKNGRQEATIFHPDAAEILGGTYNLCIYQEELMQLAQKFAGYDMAQADNLRKAMGKKVRELIKAERATFVDGCEATGYGRELGEELFDTMEPFADYAFNKSHSYGYGYVSYQTAYLKANYPTEYLASLLTSVKNNLEKAGVYLNECRQFGISVLVPNVNLSDMDFSSVPEEDSKYNAISFGLSAVRNVGEGIVEKIIQERTENGPYEDFYDFCERVDYSVLNKRAIESLVKAGAFDCLDHDRKALFACFQEIVDMTMSKRKEQDMGVMTLFGAQEEGSDDLAFDDRPQILEGEYEKSVKLAFEKEMLGLYISDHPLLGLEAALSRKSSNQISQMDEMDDGANITIAGVISTLVKKWTRKGDLMGVFTLEDLSESTEVMVFPRTFADYGHLLEDDRIIVLRGRVDKRDDTAKIIAQGIQIFEPELLGSSTPLRLSIRPENLSDAMLTDIKALLHNNPGDSHVFIHLSDKKVISLSDKYSANIDEGLIPELRILLGEDSIL